MRNRANKKEQNIRILMNEGSRRNENERSKMNHNNNTFKFV